MTSTAQEMESAVSRAYSLIERFQARLDQRDHEPIAVVGMSCRFPGGVRSPEEFWELLIEGHDGVTEVPEGRWSMDYYDPTPGIVGHTHSKWGGFIEGIDVFDPDFFGISRREAEAMDPQQRLLLEGSWEALEDAHIPPATLAGRDCGVWTAMCSNDYRARAFSHEELISPYAATGNANSIASGRLSYFLDLRGPSVTVDTACSSSLVAVHQACASLRSHEASTAICGAVNIVLSPTSAIAFSQFPNMLAADGRCKTFDGRADGFVRSEGCGVVVLKRLSDALADGDRVHGVIRTSSLNQDGRSSGLTGPNGAAQRALAKQSLRQARLSPADIGYVETHGAGTRLGDPIEVDALRAVLDDGDATTPVYLGAVKTNLGHLEAAAGMAGLLKTLLVLRHGQVPPNLHLEQVNEFIDLNGSRLRLPTDVTPLPKAPNGPRCALVSSFGFSGTNAQLVVEEYTSSPTEQVADEAGQPQLALLSAPTEHGLVRLARRYRQKLPERVSLDETCHAVSASRATFGVRAAAIVHDRPELEAVLDDIVAGTEQLAQMGESRVPEGRAVFLFTGQGPQRVGMGRGLYESEPVVRAVLDRCDAALGDLRGARLLDVMHGHHPDAETLIQDMSFAQPTMAALELATAQLWCERGLTPSAVMGHSLGEYAAACFAGVLTIEELMPLVARRGLLLQRLADCGAMASLEAPADDVQTRLMELGAQRTAVAAINGSFNTVVSGPVEEVEQVMAAFAGKDRRVKRLTIATSSHSPLVEAVVPELAEALDKVSFQPPQVPLVSNTTGEYWPVGQIMSTDYWIQHARQPVRFMDCMRALEAEGERVFVELGPARTLLGLAADSLLAPQEAVLVASLNRHTDDRTATLQAMADLFTCGVDLDWAKALGGRGTAADLPHHPFEKIRCWQDLPESSATDAPMHQLASRSARETSPAPSGSEAMSTGRCRARAVLVPSAAELAAQAPEDRQDWLTHQLGLAVAQVMGHRGRQPAHDQPLIALGMDSLMAVELRNDLRNQLAVTVPVAHFLGGATLVDLAIYVLEHQSEAEENDPVDSPLRRGSSSTDSAVTFFLDQLENTEAHS